MVVVFEMETVDGLAIAIAKVILKCQFNYICKVVSQILNVFNLKGKCCQRIRI